MRYIKVRWIHHYADEPVEIYCEIDEGGWESRKIEIFTDGSASFASPTMSTGTSILAEIPFTSLEEINSDPQFQGTEISKDEFEKLWTNATR